MATQNNKNEQKFKEMLEPSKNLVWKYVRTIRQLSHRFQGKNKKRKYFTVIIQKVPHQRERISEIKGEGAVFRDIEIVQYTGYKPRTSFKLYHL